MPYLQADYQIEPLLNALHEFVSPFVKYFKESAGACHETYLKINKVIWKGIRVTTINYLEKG
jgi:hypothetical protein